MAHRVELTEVERAALTRAGAESIKPSGWQPIETAPKDGSLILAWFNEAEHYFLLWWFDGFWRFKGSALRPVVEPTHWMPLPEPPKCL